MTDPASLARKYLEQQREVGGEFVIRAEEATSSHAERHTQPEPHTSAVTSPEPQVDLTIALPPPGLTFDPPGGDLFSNDPIQRAHALDDIVKLVAGCTRCRLCEGRTTTVPGEGPRDARLVVVGEGPGRREDETGRPFVGQAGELLTKILAAIELPRDQVYICNIVKCRPPENRTPLYDEIAACIPYLYRQIELIAPRVILAMGNTAAQTLLNTKQSLGALRDKVHRFRNVPVIVTYHPAALLRNPNWKKPTWHDVRIARRLLDA